MLAFWQHFNTDSFSLLIIDTLQIVILLLEKSSFYPLTQGHTLRLSNPKRRELKALKEIRKLIVLQHTATNFTELLSHIKIIILSSKPSLACLFHWGISIYCGQDVCGWAGFNSVQKECPSYSDLLECFLQLWTLHCLPWTYNFGLAMSNKLNT